MRRISFDVPPDSLDELLDVVMPMLPRGVELIGTTRITARGPALPSRADLEEAVGRPLEDWREDEVPADWRLRTDTVPERYEVRGQVVEIERRGSSFGAGAHPTTRMCLELLAGLEPKGALVDLGCGLGTLAIAAAKLGWSPVFGVDRDAAAIAGARENAARNGAGAEFAPLDLERAPPPLGSCLLVNAPRAVHARLIEALTADVEAVIISSLLPDELEEVLTGYAAAGLHATERREDDGWAAALLTRETREGGGAVGQARGSPQRRVRARTPGAAADSRVAELLDPERVLAGCGSLVQLASAMDGGGLIVSSARTIEEGVRATVVLVPRLFRFDLTPSGESLAVAFRPLSAAEMRWRAEHETLDGFRRGEGEPLVFHGEFDHPERRLRAMLQVLSLGDPDQNALHLVSKCAIR